MKIRAPFLAALALLFGVCFTSASAPPDSPPRPSVIVVVGAAGEEEYGKEFRAAATNWLTAAERGGAKPTLIGVASATNDLDQLRAAIAAEPTNTLAELWLVLLGHGTWDGKEARFNLRGPDLTAADTAALLAPFSRPVALVAASSSSAPFLKTMSRTNRVVVTATRSGSEENYSRFGKYLSAAIAAAEADLDQDGQTSLLEAFLFASRQVAEFYKNEGRLATEHALIDDNGDGLGTPADWFRGIHAIKTPADAAALDGRRAHQWHLIRSPADQTLSPEQRAERDALELQIQQLRDQKAKLSEDDYFSRLEPLLRKLGQLLTK